VLISLFFGLTAKEVSMEHTLTKTTLTTLQIDLMPLFHLQFLEKLLQDLIAKFPSLESQALFF
jgi:hypothetical protein